MRRNDVRVPMRLDDLALREKTRLRWSVVVFALIVGALELFYLLIAMAFNGLIL